jgi:uncharacterized protein YbaP (TraB family)
MTLLRYALLGLAVLSLAACGQKEPAPAVPSAAEPAPGVAAPATANPALWRTGDADTTVYLFGTVHVLPPDLEWRTPLVDEALGESKAVYFETDLEPDPQTFGPLITQLGMYPPSEKLSDRLSPEDRAAFRASVTELGLPFFQIDSMKPWLAGVSISEALVRRAGYDVNSGVERRLAPAAQAAGKEIRKFETVEEQLLVFADMPEDTQIRFLMEGVRQIGEAPAILDGMVKAWAAGDVAGLEKLLIEDDLGATPEVYEALLVRRNANWTGEIDTLIRTEPGVFFVAVGGAHLIGEDSVNEMLKARGYTVEREE